jgi:eukaryotic-like serine/threonine-protein kinase
MGVVYKAHQRSLHRIVAVKLILSGRFASKESVERLRAEAMAAAALRHPNIVAIYELGQVDGQHYFAMDYVEGRSLAEVVRHGPIPGRQAARYLLAIARAVHYGHQRGTLHRDLKPSNVLIDEQDQPRITDFGLAKRLNDGDGEPDAAGEPIGSPGYMPPEQARGDHDGIDIHSDVYSLGALLYDLLTGRPPFCAETMQATLDQVLHNPPASPRALNPNVPRDLETICLKCLQKEPAHRYLSAQELADELGCFLEGKPIRARPVGVAEQAWRWCSRNSTVAGLGALVFLLFASGLAGVLWQWRRAENYARRESARRVQAEHALTQLEMESLQGGPTNGLAYARLARGILRLEGYEESYRFARAEMWSQRALGASPESSEVWLAHAEVMLKQRKLPRALAAVTRAKERQPDFPDVGIRKGELLRDHGAWIEAVPALKGAGVIPGP